MERASVLPERFTAFAEECRRAGLVVYARLSEGLADEPLALDLLAQARPGQARPVLLLAAVQRLLFDHPGHPLARFFPSISGGPVPPGDPLPDARSFLAAHRSGLEAIVRHRATQTNEVNRSIAVAAGLRAATADLPERPVALVELGPSAGLNLLADRYAVDLGDGVLHQEVGSPVHLRTRLVGGRPDVDTPLPPVVERVGLDLQPIDVRTDRDELRWLEACLWPEQLERVARFRAAVEVARAHPPRLVHGDLVDDLGALLDGLPAGAHAVVVHSWVLTYVARDRRPALVEVLRAAATARPVSWLSAEGAGVVPGVDVAPTGDGGLTVLALRTFRGGADASRVLGTCHPHLAWLDWQG